VQVVSDGVNQVTEAVVNAFQTIKTTAGDFAARVADTWQAGVNSVTWLVDTAGQQILVLGDQFINASKEVALGFVKKLEEFGKAFSDLWAQLQQFGASAKQVLSAIVSDPGTFFGNLGSAVGTGIQNFFSNLGSTLPNAFMKWLTQGLGEVNLNIDWTSPEQVGEWLLGFFHLTWPDIQNKLVQVVGAGNVVLVTKAYGYVSQWINEGVSGVFKMVKDAQQALTPDQIVQQVLTVGTQYITQNLVPAAIKFIATKFAVPAVGIISTIYNTITWLMNSLKQVQDLVGLATTIVNQIGGIASGAADAISNLQSSVTNFLNGLIPVGINFLASQLGLDKLPQAVAGTIAKVQNLPLDAIGKALDYLKGKALTLLGFKDAGAVPQGLVGDVVPFYLGDQLHHVWTVVTSGNANVMIASNPQKLVELPAEKDKAKQDIIDQANVLAQAANKAVKDGKLAEAKTASDAYAKVIWQLITINGGSATPPWKAQMVEGTAQTPGAGIEYVKAGNEFRRDPGRKNLRDGSSNLAAALLSTNQGPKYLPGLTTTITKFNTASDNQHAEETLISTVKSDSNGAPLQEIFSERYPCSKEDVNCQLNLAQVVQKQYKPGSPPIVLYFMVPWVPNDLAFYKTRLLNAYVAYGFPLRPS